MKEQFITWLNRFLVLDVFLVIFASFWLVLALIGQSLDIPLGFSLWYKLWEPVFTPAIGILIMGVIGSWLINKISQFFNKEENSAS